MSGPSLCSGMPGQLGSPHTTYFSSPMAYSVNIPMTAEAMESELDSFYSNLATNENITIKTALLPQPTTPIVMHDQQIISQAEINSEIQTSPPGHQPTTRVQGKRKIKKVTN